MSHFGDPSRGFVGVAERVKRLTEWFNCMRARLASIRVPEVPELREPLKTVDIDCIFNDPMRSSIEKMNERMAEMFANRPAIGAILQDILEELRGEQARLPTARDRFILARYGTSYFIAGFGEQGVVRGLTGFRYIEQLAMKPGQCVAMLDLVGSGFGAALDERSRQPAFNEEGRNRIATELNEIEISIEQARRNNDEAAVNRLRTERDALLTSISASVGLGGYPRDLNDAVARPRARIHNALRRAYTELRKANSPMTTLADHFEKHISSEAGAFTYNPATVPKWTFDLPFPGNPHE